MENTKRIVEVGGVKVEVDLRTAKTVSEYKVGDRIKLLKKDYSTYEVYPAVIVGFDEFQKLPTIIIAYVKNKYSEYVLDFAYLNSESKDMEIATMQEWEVEFDIEKAKKYFEEVIKEAKYKVQEKEKQYDWFMSNYNKFFLQTQIKEENK